MPTNDSRFAAAMMPPLSFAAGRCCMSAFTGTAKKPAQKPSIASSVAEPTKPCGAAPKIRPVQVIPMEPRGISPYSILLSLIHPAAMLPIPMPTASMAFK